MKRGRNGYVETPFPPGTFLSVLGVPDHNILPPNEAEIEKVKALGYQNAVGSLNWAARHCYPEIASRGSIVFYFIVFCLLLASL